MKLKRTHLVSIITNLMGLMALLCLVVFSIWATLCVRQAVSAVETSTSESSTYQHMLYVLAQEETLQYQYELTPSIALRQEHHANATTLSALIQMLQKDSDTGDESISQHVLAQQARYLSSTKQLFAAIDAREATRARVISSTEVTPVFNQIEQELTQETKRQQAISEQQLAQLNWIQQMILVGVPITLVIGLLLIGITFSVQRSYRKKFDEAALAEIARYERIAFTDTLTGLSNHSAFQEHLARTLEEAQRNGEPLTLAMLDIDEFTVINDEQGHLRGDEILCALATLLREANFSDMLFRLSADDFVVIVPQTALKDASVALDRFREDVGRRLFDITVSIGLTHTCSGELALETFQAQAALALQEAKRLGRNRMVIFESIENEVSFVPLVKRQAVRRLLSERKLTIAFQPIWNLATGMVLAYEALTRPEASYGFSGPQELFDIADQMGRVHELDAICVEKILARATDLPPNALLFMNLTPQSFVHDLLTGAILLEAVVRSGLEPSRVVLEITERSIMNLKEVVQEAKLLRLMGFRIALDDAGAGNAGLEMLSQLSVDFVKIDRAVVMNALIDPVVRSVFVGITTIARESHSSVVAEGIENTEMLDFVQQAGVQYVQGYLLGYPSETIPQVSASQNLSLLASREMARKTS